MSLQRHILSLFIIIIVSFGACYCSKVQEGPLSSINVHDSPSIDDDYGWTFKNFIKQTIDFFSSNEVVNEGCTKPLLRTINVNDYGAIGNGLDDNSVAFKEAWQAACSYDGDVILVVSEGDYLLKPIKFSGPCKSNITVEICGTLEASNERSDYSGYFKRYWIIFDSVEKLSVNGGGTLNGNGNIWWENSCKRNKKKPCKDAPTAVTFHKCKDLTVEDLTIVNAQQMHVRIQDTVNVNASGLKVTAPENSPNTDGIHVTNSQIVQISSSVIGTGTYNLCYQFHGSRLWIIAEKYYQCDWI
ncbi:putative polygalacturonase [Lupinus albus]|uniref:Putative polygalacturonase n=1 Tax=Lupinus albus TaxID=3870 RepID=A0A6A4R8I2_LUPAL|nr:putative polygalacturonase [Lupinus albus]